MTSSATVSPRIDPRRLRPARKWYLLSAAIVVFSVLGGVGLGVAGMAAVMRNLPTFVEEFDGGRPTTVTLPSAGAWAIYATADDGQTAGVRQATCTVTGPNGAAIAVRRLSYEFTVSHADRAWVAVAEFTAPSPGRYQLGCTGTATAPARYAVGDRPERRGLMTGLVGSVAALVGLPCLGTIVGGVVGLVVAVRRGAHRNRLRQAVGDGAMDNR